MSVQGHVPPRTFLGFSAPLQRLCFFIPRKLPAAMAPVVWGSISSPSVVGARHPRLASETLSRGRTLRESCVPLLWNSKWILPKTYLTTLIFIHLQNVKETKILGTSSSFDHGRSNQHTSLCTAADDVWEFSSIRCIGHSDIRFNSNRRLTRRSVDVIGTDLFRSTYVRTDGQWLRGVSVVFVTYSREGNSGRFCMYIGGMKGCGQGMNVFSGLVWFWEKFCLKWSTCSCINDRVDAVIPEWILDIQDFYISRMNGLHLDEQRIFIYLSYNYSYARSYDRLNGKFYSHGLIKWLVSNMFVNISHGN